MYCHKLNEMHLQHNGKDPKKIFLRKREKNKQTFTSQFICFLLCWVAHS